MYSKVLTCLDANIPLDNTMRVSLQFENSQEFDFSVHNRKCLPEDVKEFKNMLYDEIMSRHGFTSTDEFTEDERLKNEKVLVQGVTDCIYENEAGELILVDYKTDRVSYDNYVEELTLRHKNQLTYYKKACELMFERPIDRVIIYSVPLAKNVEVKI
jgi:ATP-dependent exoDNAse (exonuclease V) beta subunit